MRRLIRPDVSYRDSFMAAMAESTAEGRWQYIDIDLPVTEAWADFVAGLRWREHAAPRPGWMTDTILWMVDGGDYLGTVAIRHQLTPALRQFGGHIGYQVRPSKRREGHGTVLLRMALPYAYAMGLDAVMLTCDATNIASRRIIEANGGTLEDVIQLAFRPVPTMRWWIDLSDFHLS